MIIVNFGKNILNYEASRFLITGALTVSIDLISYLILTSINIDTSISKGISFSIGTIFAFFANRTFTFRAAKVGYIRFIVFCMLYLSTLIINILTNEFVLNLTRDVNFSLFISFFVATSLSASVNFIGMKFFIFSKKNLSKS